MALKDKVVTLEVLKAMYDSQDVDSVKSAISGKLNAPATAGTNGQVLTSDGQGGVAWASAGTDPSVVEAAVSDWLDDHPEATSTVADGSITKAKLSNAVAEELEGKASAIISDYTAYSQTNVSSFRMNGNAYAFGNARYADKKNLIVGTDKTATLSGVSIESHGNIILFSGTGASSNDMGIWVDDDVDIPAGSYIFKIEPDVGSSTFTRGKNMHLDIWYDGNTSTTQDLRVTLEGVQNVALAKTFTASSHVYKIRVWTGVNANTYDGYKLFYSLFPSDVTITDTGETIAPTGSLLITPSSTMSVVDTMMHTSTTETVIDTKTYVDNHTQEVDFVCFRPEDFGAVGDGVADDSAAIQACINAAQAYNMEYGKAIRGYGTYKIATGIVFSCRELDVYLHKIIYTGTDAAITISGSYSKFEFQSIRAYSGSNAVGIRCLQTQNSGYTTTFYHNIVKCNWIRCGGNTVELKNVDGITVNSIMYNSFYFLYQRSDNANIIEVTTGSSNENDFYGKLVSAQNGYLVHFTSTGNGEVRLYHYCLENELANGTNGPVKFIFCRFAEMENLQTSSDRTKGRVFVWENRLAKGQVIYPTGGLDLVSVDVTNAYSFEDCLDDIKTRLENGQYTALSDPWIAVLSTTTTVNPPFATISPVQRTANAHMTPNGGMVNIPIGDMIVYYKNIAYKPYNDIYCKVDNDMTILLSESNGWVYVTPTTFDIDAASVTITLDASYCCIAINEFDVIQHAGKTAIVVDKLGNTIFDGTNLGAGVYHFKCDFVPYKFGDLFVTLDGGQIRQCPAGLVETVYSGYNEKWTVTKEDLIEAPVQS